MVEPHSAHDHQMDMMAMSCINIRASSLPAPAKAPRDLPVASSKRRGPSESDDYFPRILAGHTSSNMSSTTGGGYWISSTKSAKRGRLLPSSHQHSQLDMHQSTCLNLSPESNVADSDFWILPDFDDWEMETPLSPQVPHQLPSPAPAQPQQTVSNAKGEGAWSPLVKRAANSNRERLRRRLEGDGWEFLGGKYGEDGKVLQEAAEVNDERVDEEFDVVVLPVVQISC